MTVEEIAKDYVQANPEDDPKKAAIEAFLAGVQFGRYEAMNMWNTSKINMESMFIDLGLPTGTLWGLTLLRLEYIRYARMNFVEAQRFRLPTKKQCEEMIQHCHFLVKRDSLYINGENGKKIFLQHPDYGFSLHNEDTVNIRFWIDETVDADGKAQCLNIALIEGESMPTFSFETEPAWHDLPVLVIKNVFKLKCHG